MRRRMALAVVCLVLAGLVSVSCGEEEAQEPAGTGTSSRPAEDFCRDYERSGFVVAGAVEDSGGSGFPLGSRVYVAWGVSVGQPDYTYLSGEGCYDATAGRYVVSLTDDPPPEALNPWEGDCQVGVGVVMLNDREAPQGVRFSGANSYPPGFEGEPNADIAELEQTLLAFTDRFAIVFITGDCSFPEGAWQRLFPKGYSLGRCVPSEGRVLDGYEPVDPLVTDANMNDVASAEVCNWT